MTTATCPSCSAKLVIRQSARVLLVPSKPAQAHVYSWLSPSSTITQAAVVHVDNFLADYDWRDQDRLPIGAISYDFDGWCGQNVPDFDRALSANALGRVLGGLGVERYRTASGRLFLRPASWASKNPTEPDVDPEAHVDFVYDDRGTEYEDSEEGTLSEAGAQVAADTAQEAI